MWANILYGHLTKENRHYAYKYTEEESRLHAALKKQIKNIITYHYLTLRMAKMTRTSSVGDVEQ